MLRDSAVVENEVATVGSNEAEGEVKEARILNRIIRVTSDGWEYEADQRHADLIIQETGADKMSVLTHPGGDKKVIEEEEKVKSSMGRRRRDLELSLQGPTTSRQTGRTYSTRSKRFAVEWASQSRATGRS